MKTDKNGQSTCPAGEERYELFPYRRDTRVQYDYRHTDGELFSGVFANLHEARKARHEWLFEKIKNEIYEEYGDLFEELAEK